MRQIIAVIAEALRQKTQVVVCGHIHHATIRQAGPVLFMNCGDWVESRTAIAEHKDGRLELIRWDDVATGLLTPLFPLASALQPSA